MKDSDRKSITFKFDGKDVTPASFGSDLVTVLSCLFDLAECCGAGAIGIESVSANCLSIKATVASTVTAVALLGGGPCLNASRGNAAIRKLNACMVEHSAALEVSDEATPDVTLHYDGAGAKIPEIAVPDNVSCWTATIYGELLDVGGASPNIHILTDDGEKVKLDIGREQARKIASRLYQPVGVFAECRTCNGVPAGGRVIDVLDYAPGDFGKWLDGFLPKFGGEYEGVDVADYMKGLRG